MIKKISVAIALAAAVASSAQAASTDEEIALLKAQVKLLTEKLERLEQNQQANNDNAAQQSATEVAEKKAKDAASWASRIKFSGDFRDRLEYIDQRGRETRTRNRIRLRASATAQVTDDLEVGFRLASGGDDPVSTNQTLDDAFSTKDIRLDLAYFSWDINDAFKLIGGKMKNPFHLPGKTPIMWDGDLNPEGWALGYKNGPWKATMAGFEVEERSSADDTQLLALQVTREFDLGENALIAGLGYYDYRDLQGQLPLFDGDARGNTLDANGRIANDFNLIEALVEYRTSLAGRPLLLYGNAIQNRDADAEDSAFTLGFEYGKIKNAWDWKFGYAYLDIEADAVYALFNDSDFGAGDTDSKGHIFKGGLGLTKNTEMSLTWISSELNQSSSDPTDYDRLQLDLILKFK